MLSVKTLRECISRIATLHREYEKQFRRRRGNLDKVNREIISILSDLVRLFKNDADSDTYWERQPSSGPPGSIADRFMRSYRICLDGTYTVVLSWYDGPSDAGVAGSPEYYRESFSVQIEGEKDFVLKTGLLGLSRRVVRSDFPHISLHISQLKSERRYRFENDAQNDLFELGSRLHQKLG